MSFVVEAPRSLLEFPSLALWWVRFADLAADSRCEWMGEREYRGASLTGKLDDMRKGVGVEVRR